ncbi:MAG: hypothetical protein HY922_10620 [Elusimicrobia bacterium]|nr:hypothetical protein [Elusimicrobiota bacterium]
MDLVPLDRKFFPIYTTLVHHMRLDPARSRRILLGFLIFVGPGSGVCLLHKAFADNQLVLSLLLPVIAESQALKVKVAEARRIALQLDKETLVEKTKLPTVLGVFDPIHLGLAKPAKPNEYGGGMLPRLEFIEKNLSKSLQDLAKLPSAYCPQGPDGTDPEVGRTGALLQSGPEEMAEYQPASVEHLHGDGTVEDAAPPV